MNDVIFKLRSWSLIYRCERGYIFVCTMKACMQGYGLSLVVICTHAKAVYDNKME